MSRATPRRKSSACTASAAALIAPADVPQTTGKGSLPRRPTMRTMARSAPTWYAARAPPPESTIAVSWSGSRIGRVAATPGARSVRSRIISIAAVAPQMKRSP